MGVVVKDLAGYINNKAIISAANFTINDEIVGVVGNSSDDFFSILDGNGNFSGSISVSNEVNNYDMISLVDGEINFILDNVRDEMILYINKKHYKNNDMKAHMSDCLQIVGLDDSYFKRDISKLSSSEKLLFKLALGLVSEPKLLIINHYLEFLDFKNRQKVLKLFKMLKSSNNCSVLVHSIDSNILYQNCDKIMVINDGHLEYFDIPSLVFTKIDVLKRSKILVPDLINFTYLASFKKIKLSFHKDIRDLIKDVYKHV